MVELAITGDVMLGRGVNEELLGRDPRAAFGDVLPVLEEADLRLMNLECAVTSRGRPWSRSPKVFHFRADPDVAIPALLAAGVDACALANNHILDFEEEGLFDTLAALDDAGVARAGAGRDLDEARRPALLDAGDARVAVLAVTDNEPGWAATPSRPGTAYLPISTSPEVLFVVEEGVAAARAQGASLVVLSSHWGPNMVTRPPPAFQRFARAVIDRGVDVFWGHSAHVFQGVELYRGRPILYDTGDFLDDYAVDPVLRNDWSFVFRLRFEAGDLARLELIPVELGFAEVHLAKPGVDEVVCQRMAGLSSELGTRLVYDSGRLSLVPEEASPRLSP